MLRAGSPAGVTSLASDRSPTLSARTGTTRQDIPGATVEDVGGTFQNVQLHLNRHELLAGNNQFALGVREPLLQDGEFGGSLLLQPAVLFCLVSLLLGQPQLPLRGLGNLLRL